MRFKEELTSERLKGRAQDEYPKTVVFMAGLTVLLVMVGGAIGGRGGMLIAFILAAGMNVVSYWYSDKVVLAMYGAREVNDMLAPELCRTVRTLAASAGLPTPKIYVVPGQQPNAFATGRDPEHAAIAVTQGIMRMLNQDELAGVIGHELAHIKNRDILIGTVAATIAGAISMIATMAQWAMIFGGGRRDEDDGGSILSLLVKVVVAPIAAMLIQMAISRSRQYLADESGARIAGNPRSLASALRKLDAALVL